MRTLTITATLVLHSIAALALGSAEVNGNIVQKWNDAALIGVRDARLPAPEVARALAVVSTCVYEAWAAYDDRASGTQLKDLLHSSTTESTTELKKKTISYAYLRALTDVLPIDSKPVYLPLMERLGYDPNDVSTDLTTPSGIGNVACAAVLAYRHHDRSNQLGDLSPGPYSDWTGYSPRNKPTAVPVTTSPVDPDHWQPLTFINGVGDRVTQTFAGAQWSRVMPFALTSPDEFRDLAASLGPVRFGSPQYAKQVDEMIAISSGLTDREKVISEFWTDGVYTEQPPGHWMRIAQWVSERDHHTLDDDVKFFFVLSNAMMDAGIAAWDTKVAYDSVRPITAVTTLDRGKTIRAWGGPGKGTVEMDGSQWIPYQPASSPTPPFPEFVSGHSAYSAAAAEVLRLWTGSDAYGGSAAIGAGESKIEPGVTPRKPVTLHWATFTEAANEAGMSRRYGGIHFAAGDQAGRLLGRAVADKVWKTTQGYFNGNPVEQRLLAAETP
jgi:hypothetical protein